MPCPYVFAAIARTVKEGRGGFQTRPYIFWLIVSPQDYSRREFVSVYRSLERQNLRDPIASSRRFEPPLHRGEELQGLCHYLSHSLYKGKGSHYRYAGRKQLCHCAVD
jgi:hypothetical protein